MVHEAVPPTSSVIPFLLGAVQASASSAPCPCSHCLYGKAQNSFRSEILGENKRGRQTDSQSVGLVFTGSALDQ